MPLFLYVFVSVSSQYSTDSYSCIWIYTINMVVYYGVKTGRVLTREQARDKNIQKTESKNRVMIQTRVKIPKKHISVRTKGARQRQKKYSRPNRSKHRFSPKLYSIELTEFDRQTIRLHSVVQVHVLFVVVHEEVVQNSGVGAWMVESFDQI